eukprot:XP_001697800.1 predicted protein [Chlamydomonas reinhardtii]
MARVSTGVRIVPLLCAVQRCQQQAAPPQYDCRVPPGLTPLWGVRLWLLLLRTARGGPLWHLLAAGLPELLSKHRLVKALEPLPAHALCRLHPAELQQLQNRSASELRQLVCAAAATGSLEAVDAALEATQLSPGAWLVSAAAGAEGLRPGVALALCKRLCARGCPVEQDPDHVYIPCSTLRHAAKAGNADVCEWLLARGRCRWLAEAVYDAAAAGHVGLVRVLLARCPGERKHMLDAGRLLVSAAGGYPLPALEELYNHWLGTRRAQLQGQGQQGQGQAAPHEPAAPVDFGPAFDEEAPDGFHCFVSSSDFESVLAAAAGSPTACWLGKLDALLQWHCGEAGPGLLARSPSVLDHVFVAAMSKPDGLSRGCTSKAYDQLVKAAAERGHVDIVRWLIEQPAPLVVDMILAEVPGADRERVEMSVRRSAARMALDTGVCGGRPEVVRCVLQLGMEGVAPGSRGHRRSGSNSWTQAALSGSAATLQAMAEAGYAVYHCDLYETAAPHLAVLRMLCRLRCRGPGAHLALAALLEDPAVPLILSISCYLLLVTGADMDDDSNIASNQGFRNVSLGLPEWESERREALMSDDDFSIVDAMSASSSSALDNVTRVLDRAAARGRLAEAVEPNPLFVNLLVSHPHLGLLVGRSTLAEVLVQVVEKLQDPELLAAALDVLQCLMSTEAEAPLALAAVGFLKGPLAALSQLPPEQRAQLAADVTALLRAQVDMGAAAGAAGVADCLELMRALLQQDAAAVAAAVASSAGGASTSAAACSAALGAGCLPVMCAVLRASSSLANPQEQAAAGDVGGAVVGGMLTLVQDLVLWCLINIATISGSVTTSCSAQPAQQGSPQAQMLSAGGTALLVPLLRAPAAAKRVLQLLIWLAAADGPEAQQQMTAALAEACARCPEIQRQLVGAAGSCVTELQQSCPRPVASSQQLQLLLESVAAVVQGQPSVAAGLLLPDWGGLPLVRAALRCLGVGAAAALRPAAALQPAHDLRGASAGAGAADWVGRRRQQPPPELPACVPAAFVMRLAVAAVPFAARYVRDLLAPTDSAEPPAASEPLQLEILLRALHAAVAALLATSGGAAVMRETDGCVAGDLVGDLVPLLLGILVMLSMMVDRRDEACFSAETLLCVERTRKFHTMVQHVVEEHDPPLPPAVWSRLMAAAVPVVCGALPPHVCAVLLAPVAAEAAGGEAGGEGSCETQSSAAEEDSSDIDILTRCREAARVSDEDFVFAVLRLGLALVGDASHPEQQQAQLGTDHAACVLLFALGFVQQATSSSGSSTRHTASLLAAAARLLRPLASQLPREQLAMLVRALTLRVAGGSGMYGSLAAEWQLPVLLCLAACVENPLLREKDWPELSYRCCGAVCDHLVEEITGLPDSSLRAAPRHTLVPSLNQQLQQLASVMLRAALQSAAASQPPTASACPPAAAPAAALYCLAECQLAGARLQRDVDQMDEQRKELESLRTKVERLQVRDQLRVEEARRKQKDRRDAARFHDTGLVMDVA